jgi:hypothetical protein
MSHNYPFLKGYAQRWPIRRTSNLLKFCKNFNRLLERSKAHAWKVCIRQRIKGSNPFLSANHKLVIYKDIFI